MIMKILTLCRVVIVSQLFILSCSTAPTASVSSFKNSPPPLYFDQYFPEYSLVAIESETDVFAIDDEMKHMVNTELLPIKNPHQRAKTLLEHLFAQDYVNLAYESNANLTATQTYHSQTANCMSLTIMAYVLAKEAELDVVFQDVKVPEFWVRNGQYNMVTGHVNLLVKQPVENNVAVMWGRKSLQIDFDPFITKKSFPKRPVNKATILAMFYTNKGAQAMVNQNYTKAYAYLKQATIAAPLFPSSWSNLGILYRLVENYPLANKTYQYALTLNPNNLTVLNNLAMLMKKQGLENEAVLIENKLHNKRIKNPYYHALLGDEALYNGDVKAAKTHFKHAIHLNKTVHEFHYGLAKSYYQLDEYEKAKNALAKAIKLNKSTAKDQQYIAKLNWMRSINVNE